MNEFEENIYKDIKNELVQSVIDKKIDTYFTNRNELTHYYNVGKMIVDAQGGTERAKYGDELIKKISKSCRNIYRNKILFFKFYFFGRFW